MAATCTTVRAGVVFALLAATSSGCDQSDDVVAIVSALGDAGAPTPDAGMPNCETSQVYVLLSSIVRNQCRLPTGPSALAVLAAFFLQNPPVNTPAEARPPSSCDLIGGRYWSYELTPGSGDNILCPAHCEVVSRYVAAEDQRVLECQGFGGG